MCESFASICKAFEVCRTQYHRRKPHDIGTQHLARRVRTRGEPSAATSSPPGAAPWHRRGMARMIAVRIGHVRGLLRSGAHSPALARKHRRRRGGSRAEAAPVPRDPCEQRMQLRTARGVQRACMGDPSGQISAEVRMRGAIPRRRSVADAVGQDQAAAAATLVVARIRVVMQRRVAAARIDAPAVGQSSSRSCRASSRGRRTSAISAPRRRRAAAATAAERAAGARRASRPADDCHITRCRTSWILPRILLFQSHTDSAAAITHHCIDARSSAPTAHRSPANALQSEPNAVRHMRADTPARRSPPVERNR